MAPQPRGNPIGILTGPVSARNGRLSAELRRQMLRFSPSIMPHYAECAVETQRVPTPGLGLLPYYVVVIERPSGCSFERVPDDAVAEAMLRCAATYCVWAACRSERPVHKTPPSTASPAPAQWHGVAARIQGPGSDISSTRALYIVSGSSATNAVPAGLTLAILEQCSGLHPAVPRAMRSTPLTIG